MIKKKREKMVLRVQASGRLLLFINNEGTDTGGRRTKNCFLLADFLEKSTKNS